MDIMIAFFIMTFLSTYWSKTASALIPNFPFISRLITNSSAKQQPVKVITDIDDTVKSSGGVKIFGINLGGIDIQYDRGEFYPGAFQFAFELSQANKGLHSKLPKKMSVLTARARELKFALELKDSDKLCSAYRTVGEKNGVSGWGIGDVYYGSVAEWVFQERKGVRKFSNFEIMMQKDDKDGKCDYVIIGDTGEKDEDAAIRIVQKHANRIRAVFLHSVTDEVDRSKFQLKRDQIVRGVPIYYFNTYVGAATKAMASNLIGVNALNRVISEAVSDLSKTNPPINLKGSPIEYKASTQWADLNRDIAVANAYVAKAHITPDDLSRSHS